VLGLTSAAELNDFLLLGVTKLIGLLIVLLVGVLGTDELLGVLGTDGLVGVLGTDVLVRVLCTDVQVGVLGTDELVWVLGTDELVGVLGTGPEYIFPTGPAVSMLTPLPELLTRAESDIAVSRKSHM
jgi:hypothetical protein